VLKLTEVQKKAIKMTVKDISKMVLVYIVILIITTSIGFFAFNHPIFFFGLISVGIVFLAIFNLYQDNLSKICNKQRRN
jgi:hypothetical protein